VNSLKIIFIFFYFYIISSGNSIITSPKKNLSTKFPPQLPITSPRKYPGTYPGAYSGTYSGRLIVPTRHQKSRTPITPLKKNSQPRQNLSTEPIIIKMVLPDYYHKLNTNIPPDIIIELSTELSAQLRAGNHNPEELCALINELTHSSDIDSVERNIHEWCDNDTTEYQKIELALKLSHYITNYLLSLEK